MILHASAILPASHPRLFYKMACSSPEKAFVLASSPLPSTVPENVSLIKVPQANLLRKLNFILRKIRQLNPKILHIHSPEILPLLPFISPKIQVIYDVYEDFLANRKFSPTYQNHRTKHILQGKVIRTIEKIQTRKNLRFVLYAEKSYANILNAPNFQIIQNKFIKVTSERLPLLKNRFNLVYAGTFAESWGLFNAITLAENLNDILPVGLTLIGYSPRKKLLENLNVLVKQKNFPIEIIGGNSYVPYEKVQSLMKSADLGIALYLPDKSIERKFPTKFFEWSALQIPFVFTETKYWTQIMKQNPNAHPVPLKQISNMEFLKKLLPKIQNKQKLPSNTLKLYLWDTKTIHNLYAQLL